LQTIQTHLDSRPIYTGRQTPRLQVPVLPRMLVAVVMEVPETESSSRGLTSVIRGEWIRNRISLARKNGDPPFRLRARSFGWVRDRFSSVEFPGASGTVNWFEVALTAFAWILMVGVVIALLYFCYRLVTFITAT
jgi:uncharacterized membrane protein YhdT